MSTAALSERATGLPAKSVALEPLVGAVAAAGLSVALVWRVGGSRRYERVGAVGH